jgi:hypothetical protein
MHHEQFTPSKSRNTTNNAPVVEEIKRYKYPEKYFREQKREQSSKATLPGFRAVDERKRRLA